MTATNAERRRLLADLCDRRASFIPHMEQCSALWRSPEDQTWVWAALSARVVRASAEPDEAVVQFIADRLMESAFSESKLDRNWVIESLPAIVLMLPESCYVDWTQGWPALIEAVANEFEVRPTEVGQRGGGPARDVTLARLVFRAIESGAWSPELEALLEATGGSSAPAWLHGLKEGCSLNEVIDSIRAAAGAPTQDANLDLTLSELSAYERQRAMYLIDTHSRRQIWPEITIDAQSRSVRWSFDVDVFEDRHLELALFGETVAELELGTEASGEIRITGTGGLLHTLLGGRTIRLPRKRAAASELPANVRVVDRWTLQLSPGRAGVRLVLKWQA